MTETYVAFDDPATGSGENSWALCIAHAQRNKAEQRDDRSAARVAATIFGRRSDQGNMRSVQSIPLLQDCFGSHRHVDHRAVHPVRRCHARYHGEEQTRSLRRLLTRFEQRLRRVARSPRSINQILSLERSRTKIDHPPRGHDDLSNAIAGAVDCALGKYGCVPWWGCWL